MALAQSFGKQKVRVIEGRKSHRRQGTQTGKLVVPGGTVVLNCTIRDISEKGARIGVSENHPVPKRFYLIDVRSRMVHDADTVWVAYSQRGLRFVQSYSIDSRLPPTLEYLKRLWVHSSAH